MFQTVLLSIIRNLFTVHLPVVYVIQVCRQLSSRTRMVLLESCLQIIISSSALCSRETATYLLNNALIY